MLVVHLLILIVLLVIIPYFAGGVSAAVEKGRGKMLFRWINGQILLWIGIELISALLIMQKAGTNKAIVLFWCYIVAVLCYALGAMIRQSVRGGQVFGRRSSKGKQSVWNIILWTLFGCLLVLQLVLVVLNFDGLKEHIGTFYIDTPFSLWVMFLATVSGMDALMVEQVVLPMVFLCMSSGIFYLLGAKLFVKKRERHAMFMVLFSVLTIVGGYVGRTRWQAAWVKVRSNPELVMLGSVLVPYMLLLAVMILRMIRKKKK